MTIRQRSINSDEMRLRPQSQIYPSAGEAGFGPYMPNTVQGGSGPIPSQAIFDRFDTPVLDRFEAIIETRT
jgi:hypothetical protein